MSKYYTPKIIVEKPVGCDSPGYTGGLPQGTRDGFIDTKVEQEIVIQRISKDLYASPESGIRELYANEARACRQAKKLGADPHICVVFDVKSRRISLQGFDSMGMDWDTFKNVYCILGRSTNFDGKESGQFGFGRAAYTCISDIMILETYSRNTDEKYTVMGKSGVGFQTGLPTPKLEQYGTKCTMTANDGVTLRSLANMVKRCALLNGIRTIIEANDSLDDLAGECEQKTLTEITGNYDRESAIFFQSKPFVVSSKDVEAAMIIRADGCWTRNSLSFLCGIPIKYNYDGKYKENIERITINILDERKYQPTPDRERLKDTSAKLVTEEIDHILDEYIQSLPEMSFKEYLSRGDCRLVDAAHDKTDMPKNHHLTKYAQALFRKISYERNRNTSLGKTITDENFLVTKIRNADEIKAINEYNDAIKIVKPTNADDIKEIFAPLGIKTTKQYIKENDITVTKSANNKKVKLYTCGRYLTDETITIHEITEATVITKDLKKFHHMLERATDYPSIQCVKAGAIGKNKTPAMTEEEFYKKQHNYIIDTNYGPMTISQILHADKPIATTKFSLEIFNKDAIIVKYDTQYNNEMENRAPVAFDICTYLKNDSNLNHGRWQYRKERKILDGYLKLEYRKHWKFLSENNFDHDSIDYARRINNIRIPEIKKVFHNIQVDEIMMNKMEKLDVTLYEKYVLKNDSDHTKIDRRTNKSAKMENYTKDTEVACEAIP